MLQLLLYNLSTKFYHTAIRLSALWNQKARLWVAGRKNVFALLQQKVSTTQAKVWFHCASLGEFEQARPVLEAFRAQFPDFQIVLTFFSPSGYEVHKNYAQADLVVYLPEDSSQNAKKFLEIVQPTLICWTKYEFWYHYLHQAYVQNIPVVLFSAIFREKQLFFKKPVRVYRDMLHFFKHIFVQDEKSLLLLQNITIRHCSQANDTRFDRVWQIAQQSRELEQINTFKDNQPLLVVGSAWLEDWQVIKEFSEKFDKNLKFIIAPHEVSQFYIDTIKKDCDRAILFSQIEQEKHIKNAKFLIVDTIGHLSSLYRYADFAWIGGAFKQGLHNILEAATFGMPIFFGNKAYQKYKEAQDLIELQGAFAVGSSDEFLRLFAELYQNANLLQEKKTITKGYVQQNIGGSKKIMQKIQEILALG